jgi:hypothetical protein
VKTTVQTPDEWLVSLEKPLLRTINHLVLGPSDLLVVCAGFEERALAALQAAAQSGGRFSVLMVHYLPFVEENQAANIVSICEEADLRLAQATYDRENPAGFGEAIIDAAAGCQGQIVVDISAMSRLLIVQLLVALGSRVQGYGNCAVVYSEAAQYPPNEGDAIAELKKSDLDPAFAVLFLSSGVFDVTVVPELSSVAPPGTQTRLIAFPSLDAHQLTAIRAEIHPSRFDFVEGAPPSQSNAWRREAIAQLNQLDEVPNSERWIVSTLDYLENLKLLLTLYGSRPDRERILICPTGSKMQTLAVAIFRTFVRDVQIVYPTPQNFLTPSNYTIGVGPLHLLELTPFAPIFANGK